MVIAGRVSGAVFTTAPACALGCERKKIGIAEESRRAARTQSDGVSTQITSIGPATWLLDVALLRMSPTKDCAIKIGGRPLGSQDVYLFRLLSSAIPQFRNLQFLGDNPQPATHI